MIERRNVATCCRNGRDYVRETQYTICECNEEDFEWYTSYPHTHHLTHLFERYLKSISSVCVCFFVKDSFLCTVTMAMPNLERICQVCV